jgi:hypothetical protein
MNGLTRRQLLQRLVGCVASAGTVVLAQTVLANGNEAPPPTSAGPDERADRLANELTAPPDGDQLMSTPGERWFRNGGFRNGGGYGGGFRNAGFRNAGVGGGFANGGFRNGAGGGFRNGAFRNW